MHSKAKHRESEREREREFGTSKAFGQQLRFSCYHRYRLYVSSALSREAVTQTEASSWHRQTESERYITKCIQQKLLLIIVVMG